MGQALCLPEGLRNVKLCQHVEMQDFTKSDFAELHVQG